MIADLFVSCLTDQFYPSTAKNIIKVLNKAEVEVNYNPKQTCCGKIAFNAGLFDEAKKMGEKFLNDFSSKDHYIVGTNASCVGYIRNHFQDLFHNTSSHFESKRVVNNIFEFTEFLVKIQKLDFGAFFERRVVYQDSCSSLRELGLKDQGRQLLAHVKGIELVEIEHAKTCCGFGGMFSIQQPEISAEMARRKLDDVLNSGADCLVTNDISCMFHLSSFAKKNKIPVEVIHIADVLANFEW